MQDWAGHSAPGGGAEPLRSDDLQWGLVRDDVLPGDAKLDRWVEHRGAPPAGTKTFVSNCELTSGSKPTWRCEIGGTERTVRRSRWFSARRSLAPSQ